MTRNAYELIALAMRYFFAAMMLLIVLRAGRGALIDSRRAARLRKLSPMAGIVGELVVTEGDGRIRRGMRYPVIREGLIGSSRRADLSIRHPSIRRRHAYFQLTESGLRIRGHAGAKLYVARHTPVREILLGDGGSFTIGRIRLLLVLGDGRSDEDELFEPHSPAVRSADSEMESPEPEDSDAPYRRPESEEESPQERADATRRRVDSDDDPYCNTPRDRADVPRRRVDSDDDPYFNPPREHADMTHRRVENDDGSHFNPPREHADMTRRRVENDDDSYFDPPRERADVPRRRVESDDDSYFDPPRERAEATRRRVDSDDDPYCNTPRDRADSTRRRVDSDDFSDSEAEFDENDYFRVEPPARRPVSERRDRNYRPARRSGTRVRRPENDDY